MAVMMILASVQTIHANVQDKHCETTGTTNVHLYWKVYADKEQGFQLQYPESILVAAKNGSYISFQHSIPCEHVDPCDFDDDVTSLKELIDFHLKMKLWHEDMRKTVESSSTDLVISRFLQRDTLEVEVGFIDKVCVGTLEGYRITSGVEGCGEYDYYFLLQEKVTLHVKRKFITEFNPILKNYREYLNLPGVINPDEEAEIFKKMLSTFRLLK